MFDPCSKYLVDLSAREINIRSTLLELVTVKILNIVLLLFNRLPYCEVVRLHLPARSVSREAALCSHLGNNDTTMMFSFCVRSEF